MPKVRPRQLAVARPITPQQKAAANVAAVQKQQLAPTSQQLPLNASGLTPLNPGGIMPINRSGILPATPLAAAHLGAGLANPGLHGFPVESGAAPLLPGALGALDKGKPQLNATNQSALASNGTVNQTVDNDNHYTNNYFVSQKGYPGYGGMLAGIGGGVDAFQGAAQFGPPPFGGYWKGGIVGWLQRLFA